MWSSWKSSANRETKNKDIRILLDKIVRKYGGKVVNKWIAY